MWPLHLLYHHLTSDLSTASFTSGITHHVTWSILIGSDIIRFAGSSHQLTPSSSHLLLCTYAITNHSIITSLYHVLIMYIGSFLSCAEATILCQAHALTCLHVVIIVLEETHFFVIFYLWLVEIMTLHLLISTIKNIIMPCTKLMMK